VAAPLLVTEGRAAAAYLHCYMTTATSDRRDATAATATVTTATAVATTARAQWGLAELHRQQVWEEELRQQAAAGWPELTTENHARDDDDPDAGALVPSTSASALAEQQQLAAAELRWLSNAVAVAAGWPELTTENHGRDDDDPDAGALVPSTSAIALAEQQQLAAAELRRLSNAVAGLARSDPSVTELAEPFSEALCEQEQAWQQADRLQTQRWPSDDDDPDVPDDDDPDVPDDDDPDVPDDDSDAPTEPWLSEGE
jgi:hypothetical protein